MFYLKRLWQKMQQRKHKQKTNGKKNLPTCREGSSKTGYRTKKERDGKSYQVQIYRTYRCPMLHQQLAE